MNEVWSWDFLHTRTENGVQLKMLTLIDKYTRQCLAIRPERSLRSGDILNTLSEVMGERGIPQLIRSDNGPEFIAKEVQSWLAEMGSERSTLTLAALGRTAMSKVSTIDYGMNA